MSNPAAYPDRPGDRDRWILAQRPARISVDPLHPYACQIEQERAESGDVVSVATVFLTNRECPWRCLMCDLWKHTLTETVPVGAIPTQIDEALKTLVTHDAAARQAPRPPDRHPIPFTPLHHIKLYNSGSFFDPRAIPPEDLPAIAERVCGFQRVIVECHPALVGQSALRFRDLLVDHAARLNGISVPPRLEVAMGLETAHPQVLERLNKRMTLDQFAGACRFLVQNDIAVRAFILVKPPFLDESEAVHWAERSLDFAFASGVSVAVLIPTRTGNGALEALAAQGEFAPPQLSTLEAAIDYGLRLKRGRVLADLWDLQQFANCASCFPARATRLQRINLEQNPLPPIVCPACLPPPSFP